MALADFPLLDFDYRANSCPLDEEWKRRALEAIRYNQTRDRLAEQQSKWKYDISDCQCISAFGENEHDERNQCAVCGKCVADEPALVDKYGSYEDNPFCLPCVMALENVGIEEIAPLFC